MTELAAARKLRPWYLVAAMGLMWIMGVFGATSSCSELGYLRGSQEMLAELERGVEEADHPVMRMELVRQRARLEAMATMHERAFPLSAARMLLCLILVFTAAASIAGRRHARVLAIQAVAASTLLLIVAFLLQAPVREAIANAVAEDVVENVSGVLPGTTRTQSLDLYRAQQLSSERLRVGLELATFALAALALSRRRSRAFFEAMEEAAALDADSP